MYFVPIYVTGRILMVCRVANTENFECAEKGFQKHWKNKTGSGKYPVPLREVVMA